MSNTRPAIRGIGLVTALGGTAGETWGALLAGRHITGHARTPIEVPEGKCRVVALGVRAAREAIGQAGWPAEWIGGDETGLIIATSKGPVDRWLTPLLHMDKNPYKGGGADREGIGAIASGVAAGVGHGRGPRLTYSVACSSGLHALARATLMIRGGEARRVIVVAAESSFHPIFTASFERLGVLPGPGIGCRPFDLDRRGFLMSEAAAAVCIEADAGAAGGALPMAWIERFALGGDAHHLTGMEPTGTSLRRLLADVIGDRPVDLVHAHATGTIQNDPIELAAIEAVASATENAPALYSHKGALGHSLGASGLVAVGINCLIHRAGIVPPNVGTTNPLPVAQVRLAGSAVSRTVHRSLALAAGFGGPLAVVSLESPH